MNSKLKDGWLLYKIGAEGKTNNFRPQKTFESFEGLKAQVGPVERFIHLKTIIIAYIGSFIDLLRINNRTQKPINLFPSFFSRLLIPSSPLTFLFSFFHSTHFASLRFPPPSFPALRPLFWPPDLLNRQKAENHKRK